MKITPAQYQEFQEHLVWQRLKSPDYRLGQAFLNYFPHISKALIEDEQWGTMYECNIFNEISDLEAQKFIDQWVDQ
jgi:hypothetical protein